MAVDLPERERGERRAAIEGALRELAEFVEQHPQVPLDYRSMADALNTIVRAVVAPPIEVSKNAAGPIWRCSQHPEATGGHPRLGDVLAEAHAHLQNHHPINSE